ncbi:MAG: hypothetical protein ABSE07_01455 [Methanoregula sp.]
MISIRFRRWKIAANVWGNILSQTSLSAGAPSRTTDPAPTQLIPKPIAPPLTAMSTFVGMIRQAANAKERDMIIFVGIISIAVAIFLYGRKRRRERLMYLS